MKIQVSNETYSEISTALKRLGREINDGSILSLEKGDAIVPPQDFRMVAIRQNCLMAAVEVFKTMSPEIIEKETLFLEISQKIFEWCLTGKNNNGQPTQTD